MTLETYAIESAAFPAPNPTTNRAMTMYQADPNHCARPYSKFPIAEMRIENTKGSSIGLLSDQVPNKGIERSLEKEKRPVCDCRFGVLDFDTTIRT